MGGVKRYLVTPHKRRHRDLLGSQTADLNQGWANEERARRNRATTAGSEPDRVNFDADRDLLFSAFADSAFLAASVMGRDHVSAAKPAHLRRRRHQHPLALDRGHGRRRRAVGLGGDVGDRRVGSEALNISSYRQRPAATVAGAIDSQPIGQRA